MALKKLALDANPCLRRRREKAFNPSGERGRSAFAFSSRLRYVEALAAGASTSVSRCRAKYLELSVISP